MNNSTDNPSLSIVIPTYMREQVLVDTIEYHLQQTSQLPQFEELIVIDQSPEHEPEVREKLESWDKAGKIRWIVCDQAHLTRSMNRGLLESDSDIVLFTDDDVIPESGWLAGHWASHIDHPEACAIVGQILQPGEEPESIPYLPSGGLLKRYLDFPFRCTKGQYIENAMAGNLSVKRSKAIEIGGFDENFPPPVASRFESEFAKRLVKRGGKVWFEPRACLRHLQVSTGGIRSQGSHLASASSSHGVGDYYYAMKTGKGVDRLIYIIIKPFREVRTRFHFKKPWWIPVKLVGEMRAFVRASVLFHKAPKLMTNSEITKDR